MQSWRRAARRALAAAAIALAVPARAQLCPDVQTASDKLVALRTELTGQQQALTQVEAMGPETLADQDRLAHLRLDRPGEIRTERDRFLSDMAEKRQKLAADRDRRRAELERQRNETAARNTAQLDAHKAKYNGLIAAGPRTAELDAQLRAADERYAQLLEEKQRVLADLRSGKFCSECDRSAFEIERSGSETFEQHLRSVRGHAVMRPEKIQARSDAYDQQLSQADTRRQSLQRQAQQVRDQHASAVADELDLITRLQADGPSQLASLDAQLQAQADGRARDLAAADTELRTGERKYAELETQRAAEESALASSIAQRTTAYDEKVAGLRGAVASIEARKPPLEADFNAAVARCRGKVTPLVQEAAASDIARRQAVAAAREQFNTASYQSVRERELARRAALEAGRPPPVDLPSPRLAELEDNVRAAAGHTRAAVAEARVSWADGLGLRQSSFYRRLAPEVRKKLDANVETFTSGVNTARAVLRDSMGRLRAGSEMALLNNALGRGNGLSPDLAAAVESAKPRPLATLKGQLMPTIEAIAIEAAVDSRERQAGRRFDPQERVAERGYVRAMAYILDRKKQGDAMLETLNESLDTFMLSLEGEENPP